ncbi:MAG: bifunctional glutamate N-acetyltransferase/amino-acid acetyltransferase ArgJ [Methanomicrobiales archaeon]|nr:bifunctional glutamate N-acetyltransferase/amino-acid acetyltransferase ArgJ [Methanomicrobiales archaeon]
MRSICAVEGVEAAGIKEKKYGLALVRASGTAAAVFTSNRVRAAPLQLMQERIRKGRLDGILVNSGCANAFTGRRGLADAEAMCGIGAEYLGTDPERVGVASTGVIGRYLDLPLIRRQCGVIAPRLSRSEDGETAAARAIMTTDLVEKHALVRKRTFAVAGICKGSGMIAPNMGTMVALLYTDARVPAGQLRTALRSAVSRTFNRVVVDGDESTNDIAFCTATGVRGKPSPDEFAGALEECCRSLARQVAIDGEGATKLIEVKVRGAPDERSAARVARTVAGSPLVKTAVYGADPNWGRIIAAAGRAGVAFDPDRVSFWVGEGKMRAPMVQEGVIVADLKRAKAAMREKQVTFELDLAAGEGEATAWGCDLTEKYVEINGRYTT